MNLGGYNQLAQQGIFSRFRAPLHVAEVTNQQKYTSVLCWCKLDRRVAPTP
jgi:hypothetical protein